MKKRWLVISALSVAGLAGTVGLGSLAGAVPVTAATNTVNSTTTQSTTARDEPAGESTKPETNETAALETDGPGGHQDANGVNADHQFQGEE